jgi:predicted DNA-binding transcriptional regulator AlpA
MSKATAQIELVRIGLAPRLLSRETAAAYVGLSASAFDLAIINRTMPAAKRIGGSVRWDRVQLDRAVEKIANDDGPERADDDSEWRVEV